MPNGSTSPSRALDPFGPTIFLGAFLLFGIQPLLGKFLLPWFGGTPAVWTTCLLFFQGALLAGYAYAHATISRRPPADQRRQHAAVLAISIVVMAACLVLWRSPILPPASWKPVGTAHPVVRLLSLLAAAIGLPYLILSATGPLVQAWFSQTRPGVAPWRLYALSNLGSLLGLVAYPIAVEPLITLPVQALVWALGYVVYAVGCWQCGRVAPQPVVQPAVPAALPDGGPAAPAVTVDDRIPASRYALWLALAACPSLLLCAITNQLCQEVAPVPFLWIVPLALYLLSFVICFAGDRYYWRWLWQPLLMVSTGIAYVLLERGVEATFMSQLVAYPLVLFAAAMACHGELVRLRPSPSRLTAFYLTISAGGALGSGFVAIVAPRIFPGFWELHIGLWLACALTFVVLVLDQESWLHYRAPWPALLALTLAGTIWVVPFDQGWIMMGVNAKNWLREWQPFLIASAALVPLGVALRWWNRDFFRQVSFWTSSWLLIAAMGILAHLLSGNAQALRRDSIRLSRNFYGVITVREEGTGDPAMERYVLQHGRIEHGHQLRAPELRRIPASYYTETSGFGLAVRTHPRRTASEPLRIGMVGLGTGTSAAWAETRDTIRFYEINPAVLDLSRGPLKSFTYLEDCPGKVEVIMGDARLSLEQELREGQGQQFDILGIDAFSSDAIPVHLLTRQAVEIYLRHLRRPGGILAIHISNRYLDLEPVVRAAATALGLDSAVIHSKPSEDRDPEASSSTWVLLAPDRETLAGSAIAAAADKSETRTVRLWTDDFSNLLSSVTVKSIF
jgi:spermidine synthase